MKREDLKALGIADEAIDSIMALHGKDIEAHKTKLTTMQADLDAVNKQLAEAGSTIEGFKKMDVEAIRAAADDYKAKYEKSQQEAAAQVAALKFDYALDGALSGAKAKNTKAVRALMDTTAMKLKEDGTLDGFQQQLEQIRKDNEYLFADAQPAPRIVAGATNTRVTGDPIVDSARAAAGLPVK
jgi:predicted  nucleic acid-binding Zn-ribbon protein